MPKPVELLLRVGGKDISLVTLEGETADGFGEDRLIDMVMTWVGFAGMAPNMDRYIRHQHFEPSAMFKRVVALCKEALE